jgi:8-oxo-dGTP pyrophosphatase MutT (NUDIX family)
MDKYAHFVSEQEEYDYLRTNDPGMFRVVMGALILNENDEVLLTQRRPDNPSNPGEWELVWGRLNQGESFIEALHREVMEEVGVKVTPERIIGVTHFMRTPQEPEHVGTVFLCRIKSGENVRVASEIGDFSWKSIPEALKIVSEYNKPHLEFVRDIVIN